MSESCDHQTGIQSKWSAALIILLWAAADSSRVEKRVRSAAKTAQDRWTKRYYALGEEDKRDVKQWAESCSAAESK